VITTPVALLVLLSALMHATWNFSLKTSPDRLLDTVGLAVGGSVLAACLLPFVPLPEPECLPWLGLTLLVHVGYFLALVETYRYSDLSIAYPLMRGAAPVLVALGSLLVGEAVSTGLLAGIALIGAGILLPVGLGLRHGSVTRAGIGFALGNAVIIAIYTLSDGIGVRLSGSAAAYTLWLYFLNVWGILLLAWRQRGRVVMTHLRQRWRIALIGAMLSLGSYGIVLWAMTTTSIPAVAALRETSVIFAALLGTLLLRETMGRWRIAGALLVAMGAAVIRWG
jgi:drug/metabolite transporter (DMT)-like permease